MRSKRLGLGFRVAAWSGAAAGLLGIAGLVGWWLGIPDLTRIAPGYKAIAPSVAIALIVLGLILPRLAAGPIAAYARVLLAAVVGLISLFGLLELVGFAVGADLNLEDALTAHLAKELSIPFETMSPVAGALLLLIGAAMLALLLGPHDDARRRGLGDTAGALGLVAGAIALIFTLGYAYGAPLLYGGPAIPISLTAALGGVLLAMGTVAAAGHESWPLRNVTGGSARARLLRAFVPFTVFVALTVSVAEHRLTALAGPGHVLVGAALAVVFAFAVGFAALRITQNIGETIDQARLAQQRAEEALRESQADLNRAQAVAHTGSWRLNVLRNELLWSDETHRIFGVPEGTPMTYETFLATVHPDDREYVDRQWAAALRGENYDIEHRIVVGDAVRWVHEKAELEFDAAGAVLGGFGTVQDITDRKRQADEVAAAERETRRQARLLEAIVENSRSQLVYLDRDFNFVWVNPAYAEACRRPREDFAGHNHFEFYPHEENEAIFRRVRDTGQPIEFHEKPFEFPDQPERGVTYWDWTLTPVTDEKGEVEGLVFSLVDMTEQVRAREQTAAAERERARVAETIAAEINHRMKNNLMLVSGILQLQLSAQRTEGPASEALRQAISRISALSVVHEQLYEDRSGKVELQYALRRIGEMAAGALSAGNVGLSVTGDQAAVHSRVASAVSVVANELITNALKYGAPQSDGKLHVDIDLSLHDGRLVLRIWNSGNPIPADFDVGAQRGMGLQITREVATRQLKGSFALRPHNGGTMSEIVIDESVLDGSNATA
jgi:PAS domain S-box-containing protein